MSNPTVPKYRVIVAENEGEYSAYSPDVPGCFTIADTRTEIMKEIREALTFHLEGLVRHGEPIPQPKPPGPNELSVEVPLPAG